MRFFFFKTGVKYISHRARTWIFLWADKGSMVCNLNKVTDRHRWRYIFDIVKISSATRFAFWNWFFKFDFAWISKYSIGARSGKRGNGFYTYKRKSVVHTVMYICTYTRTLIVGYNIFSVLFDRTQTTLSKNSENTSDTEFRLMLSFVESSSYV